MNLWASPCAAAAQGRAVQGFRLDALRRDRDCVAPFPPLSHPRPPKN